MAIIIVNWRYKGVRSEIKMSIIVNNEQLEHAALMPQGDMPAMKNEAVTFHEVLRAP